MNDLIDINHIKKTLEEFATLRDWTQFHNAKNLSMALAVEAGELLEIFQWMSDIEVKNAQHNVEIIKKTSHELADIMLYLIRIADFMNVNLSAALHDKLALNNKKYPIELVKGSAKKYTEYSKS